MNEKAERQIIHVCDVMKPKVDFIDGMETIATALRMMQHVQNKCLIVNKRHEDDEFGVLLISDIARKVLEGRTIRGVGPSPFTSRLMDYWKQKAEESEASDI